MLNRTNFDLYYVAYRKDDPVLEPVAVEFSPVADLVAAENKTGRPRLHLSYGKSARKTTRP
jgi:hypothetical protein